MACSRPRESGWRGLLGQVPGLRPVYRALRAAWWRLKDGVTDRWWLLRGAAPFGLWSRRHVIAVWAEAAADRDRVYAGGGRLWLDSPQVLRNYVFPQFQGRNWYEYIAARYCPQPRALGLSLCCGDGEVERNLIRYRICQACEGVDISPDAIAVAQQRAEASGMSQVLTYRVSDVERARGEPARYDLIVAWMALHHLRNLRHVFREVRRALKPEGIFVVNEYVGPSRFQVPDRQVAFINSLLSELPADLRRKPTGEVKERFDRPPIHQIVRHDPSEAVSSHRILPLLRRHFAMAECVGYGGTVLNWLLEGIVQNFREDDPEHRAHLERLYAAERELLGTGRFASDFAFVVAQRPARP